MCRISSIVNGQCVGLLGSYPELGGPLRTAIVPNIIQTRLYASRSQFRGPELLSQCLTNRSCILIRPWFSQHNNCRVCCGTGCSLMDVIIASQQNQRVN